MQSHAAMLLRATPKECHILHSAAGQWPTGAPGTKGAACTAMLLALPGRLRLRLPEGTNGAAVGLKELKALDVFSSWSTMVLPSASVIAGPGVEIGNSAGAGPDHRVHRLRPGWC